MKKYSVQLVNVPHERKANRMRSNKFKVGTRKNKRHTRKVRTFRSDSFSEVVDRKALDSIWGEKAEG